MEPKRIRAIVKLIREDLRLRADIHMLGSILEIAVTLDRPPLGWKEALREGRLQPEYQSISEQYAQLLARIEQAADETELNQLLDTCISQERSFAVPDD